MKRTDTVVIGAGQAGLALSRCLTDRGIEHVLLERGRVAQRWSERWESLRLLSPNWMTRLPGWQYRGAKPDGFMRRDEVIAFLRQYATSFAAPVEEETEVSSVSQSSDRWRVSTTRGTWVADHVVVATGHCQQARVPSCSRALSPEIDQISSLDYRSPSALRGGGVLVIGASSSGVQLARELRRAGREVVLSAGRHFRVPRRYRGRDIHYWLDRTGILSRALTDMADPAAARREPSLQLAGGVEDVDLGTLAAEGVRVTGRLATLTATRAVFAGDLEAAVAEADLRMHRILDRIDRHVAGHGAAKRFPAEARPAAVVLPPSHETLDLAAGKIGTVLWATGYRRSYPWLHAPVFDDAGEIVQTRGRTAARGLYVLGVQFMTRRNSSLLDGVGRDAEEIAERIAARGRVREAA